MANKHKTRNRIMIFFLSFLLLLALGIFLFLRQPLFGKAPSGARLERMKQSPNYKDGKFQTTDWIFSLIKDWKKAVFIKDGNRITIDRDPILFLRKTL